MKKLIIILLPLLFSTMLQAQDAAVILQRIDDNLSSTNRVFSSSMTIHGKRRSRTLTSKSYSVGDQRSFTEYLTPARDKGTRMLKEEDNLWIYSPATDRIIRISGHMLRQSVMGSDLSYEDMMDDRKLTEVYNATVQGSETFDGRPVKVLELIARVDDAAYYKRRMWVDAERNVPLKEELYARSGQLLKRTLLSNVQQIDGRWFPMKINFKDMLKDGQGTDFEITTIQFDQEIPAYIFTKAALKQ